MSLVAGADGEKSIFKDGMQVDHISENTVGHGTRVRGISDPTTYPVLAGDVGERVTGTILGPLSLTTNTRRTVATISLPAGVWAIYGACGMGGGQPVTGTRTLAEIALDGAGNGAFARADVPLASSATADVLLTMYATRTVSSTTTLYFNVFGVFSAGSPSGIAESVYATRIA